jgi:hypothetical protein
LRVVPVFTRGSDVAIPKDALAVVVPVPTPRLQSGDLFMAEPRFHGGVGVYRADVADSWSREVRVRSAEAEPVRLRLGTSVWRVSRVLPHGGVVFRLLVGPIQSVVLVLAGFGLIVWAEARRHRRGSAPRGVPMSVTNATVGEMGLW